MKKWLKEFRRDFFTKEFIPLKILYFFMMGGMMTLFPFLTIQARSLGITGEELGLIFGIIPIIGIFAPSIAGLLADKVGNFKIILSLTVLASGLTSLLFLVIPPGRIDHTLPIKLPITVNCTIDGSEITVVPPFSCDVNTKSNMNHSLEIQQCLYSCTNDVQQGQMVDKFMNQWCQRTESCHVWNDVEIATDLENEKSKHSYDVVNRDSEKRISGRFGLKNKTIPLKIIPLSEKGTNFGISRIFCPDFKQLMESRERLFPSVVGINTPQKECWMACEAATETKTICNNTKTTEELNTTLTFMEYLFIRVTNGILLSVSFTLFQGAVVAILKENKGDLGLQKVYGNLGMIVMTPISGFLIDWFSKMNGKEDYSPAFALYFGIKCLCAFCLLFINLEFKQPSNRVLKDFKELITQIQVLTFIFYIILTGTCYGFVETFLFWLLEDLGADKSLMGATVTVGAACGIPLLMVSSSIIEKLGHVNTLVVCSFTYVVRLIGYSLINNPWLAMPFEALETFTNSLMAVAAISYAGVLSKPSTVASLQGIYGGAYHGIGRGLGSLIGGILMKNVGNSATFQIFAFVCGAGGAFYYVVNKFVFKNQNTQKSVESNSEKKREEASEPLGVEIQMLNQNNTEKCSVNSQTSENQSNCNERETNDNDISKSIAETNTEQK